MKLKKQRVNVTCNTPKKRWRCSSGNWMLLAVLLLTLQGCLKRSAPAVYSTIPPWPIAGQAVADELQTIPDDDYPALYNWLGRLILYKTEIDIITESSQRIDITD